MWSPDLSTHTHTRCGINRRVGAPATKATILGMTGRGEGPFRNLSSPPRTAPGFISMGSARVQADLALTSIRMMPHARRRFGYVKAARRFGHVWRNLPEGSLCHHPKEQAGCRIVMLAVLVVHMVWDGHCSACRRCSGRMCQKVHCQGP